MRCWWIRSACSAVRGNFPGRRSSKDPWVDEVLTVAATVPKGRRELALAVLKTMATAAE